MNGIPDQAAAYICDEQDKWGRIVRDAGIKAQQASVVQGRDACGDARRCRDRLSLRGGGLGDGEAPVVVAVPVKNVIGPTFPILRPAVRDKIWGACDRGCHARPLGEAKKFDGPATTRGVVGDENERRSRLRPGTCRPIFKT